MDCSRIFDPSIMFLHQVGARGAEPTVEKHHNCRR